MGGGGGLHNKERHQERYREKEKEGKIYVGEGRRGRKYERKVP